MNLNQKLKKPDKGLPGKISALLLIKTAIPHPTHGSALEGSDPHELAAGFEVCQMKGTHIGASELTLFKSYEIGPLKIRSLCF